MAVTTSNIPHPSFHQTEEKPKTKIRHTVTVELLRGHIGKSEPSTLQKILNLANPLQWYQTAQKITESVRNLMKIFDDGFYTVFIDHQKKGPYIQEFTFLFPNNRLPGFLRLLPQINHIFFTSDVRVAKQTIYNYHRNGRNEENGENGPWSLVLEEQLKPTFINPESPVKGLGYHHLFNAEKARHPALRKEVDSYLSEAALKNYGSSFVEVAQKCIVAPFENAMKGNGTFMLKNFVETIAVGGIARSVVGHLGPYESLNELINANTEQYKKVVAGLSTELPYESITKIHQELLKHFERENITPGFLKEALYRRLENVQKEIENLSEERKISLLQETLEVLVKEDLKGVNPKAFDKLSEEELNTLIETKRQSLTDQELDQHFKTYYQELIREEIFETANILMSAGRDTTSATLSRLVYLLSTHPEKQAELRKYLEHAIQENKDKKGFDLLKLIEIVKHKLDELINLARAQQAPAIGASRLFNGKWTSIITQKQIIEEEGKDNVEQILETTYQYYDTGDMMFHAAFLSAWDKGETAQEKDYIPFGYGKQKCPGRNFNLFSTRIYLLYLLLHDLNNLTKGADQEEPLRQEGPILTFKRDQKIEVKQRSSALEALLKIPYKHESITS